MRAMLAPEMVASHPQGSQADHIVICTAMGLKTVPIDGTVTPDHPAVGSAADHCVACVTATPAAADAPRPPALRVAPTEYLVRAVAALHESLRRIVGARDPPIMA